MRLQQYLRQLGPAASRFLNYVNTVYGPVFSEQIEVKLKNVEAISSAIGSRAINSTFLCDAR